MEQNQEDKKNKKNKTKKKIKLNLKLAKLKRKTKYGLKSSFMILFVVCFLLLLNIFINKFDLKYDLTKKKLYTISEQTKKIINNINQKINIYFLNSKENTDLITVNLLEQYKTKNINISYKDPENYPGFEKKFDSTREIQNNSIIVESVESKDKFKIIDANDLFLYDYDYYTSQTKLKSLNIEPELTNAIKNITSENTPVIYKLIGNGEQDLSPDYKKQIELANYELKDLDLITQSKIPDDCKILFITTPTHDWTEKESEILDNFFKDNSAIFCLNYTKQEFNNMTKVIKKYGFEFSHSIIVENNPDNFIENDVISLIPNYMGSEISSSLQKDRRKMILPLCQPIIINDNDNIEAILVSSDNSYAKTNPESKIIEKEKDDISGPLNIAVSYQKDKSKIVAIGTESILEPRINSFVGSANCDFIVSSIGYLSDSQGLDNIIYVPPKTFEPEVINFTRKESLLIFASCVILIPSLIFIYGLLIIKKRQQ